MSKRVNPFYIKDFRGHRSWCLAVSQCLSYDCSSFRLLVTVTVTGKSNHYKPLYIKDSSYFGYSVTPFFDSLSIYIYLFIYLFKYI
ncbi:hypothetical protein P7633_36 [Streptococcus phage P7633]|uniref:Uncharacterized protein n=1 Tax=Streptococcus phage P7633 TaxID=1971435 RepID=A0A286QS55_9CAUD|nr:hypothetical protein PP245_gp36 [Streptococcus phage P7633]ARU14174.1 hypothetical protein P7633_36 [Streptococcus phage P7633]